MRFSTTFTRTSATKVYELGTLHRRPTGPWRWPVLTVGFLVVATTLAQYVGLSAGALDRVGIGALEFGAMLAVVLATWRHLQGVSGQGRHGVKRVRS